MRFYIVDAFAEELFGGNPAGVVLLNEDEDFPDDEVMRKYAAEFRYSETAFVKPLGRTEFNTRYFTPAAEVDLCGHATIGAFYAMLNEGTVKPDEHCTNMTKAGKLNIVVGNDIIFMDMAEPQDLGRITEPGDVDELYRVMGISSENQGCFMKDPDIQFIPRLISTGLPDIILPVKDEKELEAISPDFQALAELSKKYSVVGVHAFTLNAKDGIPRCRNFAPLYEIDEEAATGTSNGALTYYLYQYKVICEGQENLFIQGEKMRRPSKIFSRLSSKGKDIKVQVGGKGVIVAKGRLINERYDDVTVTR